MASRAMKGLERRSLSTETVDLLGWVALQRMAERPLPGVVTSPPSPPPGPRPRVEAWS